VADVVILNAKVWTVNAAQPTAEAVAVAGDRIAAVGSTAEIRTLAGPGARVVDAGGRLVLPGFNDAHMHLVQGGFMLLSIDLRPAMNEEQFAGMLRDHVAALPKGTWVTGGNWDHESWPGGRRPTRRLIDPVTSDHPVLVRRIDGHVALANSLALKLADVTRGTADPPGGHIERDPDGQPTGILVDTAQTLVGRLVPEPGKAESLDAVRAAMRHAARVGVTSVQTPSSVNEFRVFQRLHRRGELATRIYAPLQVEALDSLCASGIEAPFGDAMLRTGAVKIFADGSLGAGSALMFEPYDDNPSTCGLAIYDEETLCDMIRRADAARLQAVVHAIGDKAVHWALGAFERAAEANGRRDARHRVEHAQLIRPDDRARVAPLGVVASIQPSHCIDDMRWVAKRMGPRTRHAYPFRSLLEAGVRVALGTDVPVEPLDPTLGLYAAVTREFPEGGPRGGWHPEEKVTIGQAIEAYTLGSAYAEFQEHDKGSIQVGKLADMVILSRDLLTIPPSEILGTEVDVTVLGGRLVYDREAAGGAT